MGIGTGESGVIVSALITFYLPTKISLGKTPSLVKPGWFGSPNLACATLSFYC